MTRIIETMSKEVFEILPKDQVFSLMRFSFAFMQVARDSGNYGDYWTYRDCRQNKYIFPQVKAAVKKLFEEHNQQIFSVQGKLF